MKVLITCSRFPHALAEVRKFGSQGHEVFAADTFWTSPGNHSRHVTKALRVASPALETAQFIEDVSNIVEENGIDLIVPACEEALYLAQHADKLPKRAQLFGPGFATLDRLHNKQTFIELAASLGLRVPRTIVARSGEELRAATQDFEEYIARAAFSRAGTKLLTNAGPLAGRVSFEECDPSPEFPWIVQEFIHGPEICSFSVAQHGKVAAHCTYEHPKTIEHAGGITYVSVDGTETLEIVKHLVEALGYHGQISFDFKRSPEGLVLIECNPRPTAGVLLMPAEVFAEAVMNPEPGETKMVAPGALAQVGVALVRDMFQDWRQIPSDLAALFSGAEDAYFQVADPLPGVFQVLQYTQLSAYRRFRKSQENRPTDLIEAQFYDIAWNGSSAA